VSQFEHLERTVTIVQEEIKRRLNSGNACYHLIENILPSRLRLINVKIRLCKTIILAPVVQVCET
jgi:hypothetical protein